MINKKTTGSLDTDEKQLTSADASDEKASAGHALGQIVGDWFQDYFAQPLLEEVTNKLGLYLDYRLRDRPARSQKIIWSDDDGNGVDYDFVMELGGDDNNRGIPVAFLECFWRRGSRHSKDKARDDSGKLAPMRSTYPTARFLGIVASGEFTKPARVLVQSREIDLFLVTKSKMIEAFDHFDIQIDYPDKLSEELKAELVSDAKTKLNKSGIKQEIGKKLRDLIGSGTIDGYTTRVLGALSALPQEIRIYGQLLSEPHIFEDLDQAVDFINKSNSDFNFENSKTSFIYEVTYSDGFEFSRQLETFDELKDLNNQIKALADHITEITSRSSI